LGISITRAVDFERNLDLKIRSEQQTAPGRQTQRGRRLSLTSDTQIEISFKIESFYGSLAQNELRKLVKFFKPSS